MIEKINQHFQCFDFDVRKSGNARFMDQKVTPDVLCVVSECIIEFVKNNPNSEFTKNDIWHFDYSQEVIQEAFNKPDLKDAKGEYDKFFSQPIKTLAYAHILIERKQGKTNFYKINNDKILEYISLRERNALTFLDIFLTKVISDSGLQSSFDAFFTNQDKASLEKLRNELTDFYHEYTDIRNHFEPPRIFNKIINIFAFRKKLKGTVKGSLSKVSLSIEDIRYNRVNWRDIGKDKSITREEFKQKLSEDVNVSGYYRYNVSKAKKLVKKLHKYSEIHRFDQYPTTQAHHIFMESEFPDLADYPENLIALTPNQHYLRAHPNNKTSIIDESYQLICLISKLDSIEMNNRSGDSDYSLEDFINVLNTGFSTRHFKVGMDYEELKHQIITFKSLGS